MAIFGNFKGTTQHDFKIGKRGVTVYTNSTIPISGVNTTNTILDGDIWLDSANDTIQVRSSNNWVSIGNTLQSLNVANGSLVVDPSGNSITVGTSSGLYVGNTHIIDGSGNWVGNIAGFGYTGSRGVINVSVTESPSVSPSVGDIWIDTNTTIQYIYVYDGTNYQWVELSNPGAVGDTGYTGSRGTVGYTGSQATLTTGSTSTSANIVPVVSGVFSHYAVTALATSADISTPSGVVGDGSRLSIRIDDNGVARSLTWSGLAYRAVGVILPSTTVVSGSVYVDCIYNSTLSIWDVITVRSSA